MSRDTDLAWAAGIIDGEGCISLNAERTSRSPHSGNLTYLLRLCVVNTDARMLKRLSEIFNAGSICPMKRYSAKHRPAWQWDLKSRKAEHVLREVLPYLICKKGQAEVGLLSRSLMQPVGSNTENPNGEQLAWLKTQLSQLKKEPA